MIEYLDQDRESVLTSLRGASTPADAQQILEKEADRLLLQYNEDCPSVRVRDAASGMVQAMRSTVPFMDTMGEPRVWPSLRLEQSSHWPPLSCRLSRPAERLRQGNS